MKNYLFFYKLVYLFTFLITFFTFAQTPPIMVCNPAGTSCTPYSTLDLAYAGANNGDYIYLPGGSFNIVQNFNKELHLVGAGFNSSTSSTTGITKITGMNLYSNSSNSTFEGIDFSAIYYIENINNIILLRCKSSGITPYASAGSNITMNNSMILNCAMNSVVCSSNYQQLASNNFFINSIFNLIQNTSYSTIKNSIILDTSNSFNITYSVLTNNLFNNNFSNTYNTCSLYKNYIVNTNDFVNVTFPSYGYSESNDYHIKPDSPAHNTGSDGTDAGIYGGDYPWKEGSLPSNPHFEQKSIGTATDTSGNLPVHIRVSSQY